MLDALALEHHAGMVPFTDWPEPERRRRLYRLWINRPGERPVDPEMHRGYITGSKSGLPILAEEAA